MVIGLTGGIGCGKTTVAGIFRELGAWLIDADQIGKSILDGNASLQKEMLRTFGESVADKNGAIDRKALGNLVFADPDKLDRLNRLIHPHLWREVKRQVDLAREENHPMIVVDAALIFEAGLEPLFDYILVVASDMEKRIDRIQKRDGLRREDIINRIRIQMDLEEKIQKADGVIDNNSTYETLRQSVLKWHQTHWEYITKPGNNFA